MKVVAAGVCKLMVPAKWDGGASLPSSEPGYRGEEQL